MPDLRFFDVSAPIEWDHVLKLCDINQDLKGRDRISGCAPLASAGHGDVAFFADRRYLIELKSTRASYVFVKPSDVEHVPKSSLALVVKSPQAAWSRLAHALYQPKRHLGALHIHPEAVMEEGVALAPGVVIGQGAVIGQGTRLEPYCVIGPGVQIGRHCVIGAHATVYTALLGDHVTVLSGAHIGEAGFGVSGDQQGLIDVPQLGRVILQDHVSVGAGTCIDRGAYGDTVVGEGTKIDNMVQIAHNVHLGRHCIIAAHSGISGSVKVGDGAMFGGRAGIIDHIEIGTGAKVAAGAIVFKDVPAGEMWSGFPAKPSRQFLREKAWLAKQASDKKTKV